MRTLTIEVNKIPSGALCDLTIEPVAFTTRNGLVVNFLRPVFRYS